MTSKIKLLLTFSAFSVIVTTISVIFLATGSMAQSSSDPVIKFKKFSDTETQISFMAPDGVSVSRPEKDDTLNNPLLLNGEVFIQIEWPGMIAQINTFDIEIDFNPVDWLVAYTTLAGHKPGTVRTLKSSKGLVFGSIEYTTAKSGGTVATAFMTVSGNRGYLISGDGKISEPLVRTMTDTLTLPGSGSATVDKTQTVDFAGRNLIFDVEYSVNDASKGESKVAVISNAASIPDSSVILLVKTGVNKIHTANVRRFSEELTNLQFTSKVLRESKTETAFELKSHSGGKFVGFVTTTGSGFSVSLIAPTIDEDANTWLSGKYYYVKAVQALK